METTTGINREQVLDAAMRLIERDGADGLTMRRLANELGVAPTAIYWHVGKRQDLIAALVDRMLGAFEQIRPRGRTPARRVVSMLTELRTNLVRQPHLVGLVNEYGQVAKMFLPAETALTRELVAAGLTPRRIPLAVRALLYHVIGFVVLEMNVARQPEQHPSESELWEKVDDPAIPPAVSRQLAAPYDLDDIFAFATGSLVDAVLERGPSPTGR